MNKFFFFSKYEKIYVPRKHILCYKKKKGVLQVFNSLRVLLYLYNYTFKGQSTRESVILQWNPPICIKHNLLYDSFSESVCQ